MALKGPDVAGPGTAAAALVSQSPTFDERWAAWQAKGAAHERAVRRKMVLAAPIAFVIVAAIFYAVFGR
jgi:hypothetical protein